MKENDVTYFGTLLSLEAKDVEAAIEDGTLGEKVKALGMLGKDQVDTLKSNLTKEVKSTYLDELTESAKKGELEGDLYKAVKGATYQMLEKDLAKKYGVTEYEGVQDLVDKISNKTGKSNDKDLQELQGKFSELQEINKNLVKEKDEAIQKAQNDYTSKLLTRERSDVINSIPFDFSDVDEKELETVTTSRKTIVTDVFNARYDLAFDDDKLIVKDKEGKMLTDSATLAPIPAKDVMTKLASELGIKLKSPETGGQGGSSSGKPSGKRFASEDEFYAHCKSKGIDPHGADGIKLFKESGLAVETQ